MIEESHAHGPRTGLPWLDLILAGSAIFISVLSLIISIHHGRTMEKLVAANEKQVKASPAIVEWLRIKWNGQPTDGPRDLLDRCCRTRPYTLSLSRNIASGMTLPAEQSQSVFTCAPATPIPISTSAWIPRPASRSKPRPATARCWTSAGSPTSRRARKA